MDFFPYNKLLLGRNQRFAGTVLNITFLTGRQGVPGQKGIAGPRGLSGVPGPKGDKGYGIPVSKPNSYYTYLNSSQHGR